MVQGASCLTKCVLVLSCVSCVLPSALHTLQPDEGVGAVDKRFGGARDPMLHYLLVAMAHPGPRYAAPQILSRGVRRIGSEFLGKRSPPGESHEPETCEAGGCVPEADNDADDLKKEQLSFTGQYDDQHDPEEIEEGPDKRALGGLSRGRLARYLSLLLHKKMGSEFLGKRAMGSEFLGKRAMGSEFLGKRAMGSEFLGKRAMGSEFLGKRAMGSEFLGKRAMGSEFLGKRAMGSEFLGKRAMGSEFLGKRAMGSEFLGKRAMGSEFLGKRVMGSEFLGKRAMGSEFLGKRAMGSEFLGKRAMGSEFLGKRAMGSEFLGKRESWEEGPRQRMEEEEEEHEKEEEEALSA
ncbi:ribosome-binding protein 1-like isoform X2 [Eriocheir sinensis]|nr:ribosome-binding protein 1-like isoform X2 [Eriocheir sinensis]XP_050726359.1 ribosome-binding protein 1-like isoform X2 [Eriocheir sinensis]